MSPALIRLSRVVYDFLGKGAQAHGKVEEYGVILTGTRDGFLLCVDDGIHDEEPPTKYSHHQQVTLDDRRVVEAVSGWWDGQPRRDTYRSGARHEQEGPMGPSASSV